MTAKVDIMTSHSPVSSFVVNVIKITHYTVQTIARVLNIVNVHVVTNGMS